MSITGSSISEIREPSISSVGTLSKDPIVPNAATIDDPIDLSRLQVGTIVIIDDPGYSFQGTILIINRSNFKIIVDNDFPETMPSLSFSFVRPYASYRLREESGLERLKAYIDTTGRYEAVGIGAHSYCILSGTNTASQSLTSDVYTLMEWDSELLWYDPSNEWSNPSTLNLFTPQKAGIYSISTNFSVLATTSSVGDIIKAKIALSNEGWSFVEVVHQRPDLDFVSTYRRNIDMQALIYLDANQSIGIFVNSGCMVSKISNSYPVSLGIMRLRDKPLQV